MTDVKRFGSMDGLRMAAALLVVAIHTSPLESFSVEADFIFTRVFARIAVPFFLMVTGYFLLPQYIFKKSMDYRPLLRFFKKTCFLYLIAFLIFLPVDLYAEKLEEMKLADIVRILIFDGPFYHLWYLPASVVGVMIVWTLGKIVDFKKLASICIVLYILGLLGDSYYGIAAIFPPLEILYEALFRVFSYTRNGIFYAPVFLMMGAWIRYEQKVKEPRKNIKKYFAGFLVSMVIMIFEGCMLHVSGVQKHDSMYIMLIPCMFFLFSASLLLPEKSSPALRKFSVWIYLIHPLAIIFVRGAAKAAGCEEILLYNSLAHYMSVCLASCAVAYFIVKYLKFGKKRRCDKGRAWVEINRENLCRNVETLQGIIPPGCELMPVVKANAYGHGAVLVSKILNDIGIENICVASLSEAIELRDGGVCGEILVLGYTYPEDFSLLRKYNLIQTAVSYDYAKLLNGYGKPIRVHLKIDTGMHRLGEPAYNVKDIEKMFFMKNLAIEGMFTHLCADESACLKEKKFTENQGEVFRNLISELKGKGIEYPKIHILASYGVLNYPQLSGDYARIGIALYGVLSGRNDMQRCKIPLFPVLSLKCRIADIKKVYAGEEVGYGLAYTASEDKMIAVISIGYADGIPRAMSCGKGSVLINGRESQILGRICMDQMMVDITGIPDVKEGDEAVLIGRSGNREITVYDIAENTGTITNEILSRLGCRLDRLVV